MIVENVEPHQNVLLLFLHQEYPYCVKTFHNRFRLPIKQYQELLHKIDDAPHFVRWAAGEKSFFGIPASSLSLLLLGALRYLGCGWTFDDIWEFTAISQEVHHTFFPIFIDYASTVLFKRYVVMPQNAEEGKIHMHKVELVGFPGCLGSTDATHIAVDKCYNLVRQLHKGPKLHLPSRTYDLTENHRHCILYTTSDHPSWLTDMTLQRFDKFMLGVRDESLMGDVVFELYDMDENSNVIKVIYTGCWLIVNNGYIYPIPYLFHLWKMLTLLWVNDGHGGWNQWTKMLNVLLV